MENVTRTYDARTCVMFALALLNNYWACWDFKGYSDWNTNNRFKRPLIMQSQIDALAVDIYESYFLGDDKIVQMKVESELHHWIDVLYWLETFWKPYWNQLIPKWYTPKTDFTEQEYEEISSMNSDKNR